jgi:NAD(P)-dependent dehydrogenase (short-subunit alcohol dehydrogenase family)
MRDAQTVDPEMITNGAVPDESAGTAQEENGGVVRDENAPKNPAAGIDPADLEICLRVLGEVDSFPGEHPDAQAVRSATAHLYKTVKRLRRVERREVVLANDRAVTAATATGAPGRIDDETRGLPLVSSTRGATAGTLQQARACYVCKARFVEVDAFYHQLCPSCAVLHHQRREARTDLTGRRALLTGGRAKIGMYIALRLLRDGAETTITTRFPHDAIRRFTAMADSGEWLDRLHVVGIDLRDPAQVVALADSVSERGPLDILINNAAQTVRRSAEAYAPLIEAERAGLPNGPLPRLSRFGHEVQTSQRELAESGRGVETGQHELAEPSSRIETNRGELTDSGREHWTPTPEALTALALSVGSASQERIASGSAIDAGGLVPDLHPSNSWVQHVNEVDPLELLEVQLCNTTAPFILVSRLRPALAAAKARRTYIVNVSAMEGQFSRGYKGPGHPHTNMAKAALNMLTRTSAQELLESDGILMTSVDTGWITDERPHPMKMRLAEDGFHAPLDLVDGAARVYDPIVRGEAGEDVHGCFLKDYEPSPW